MLFSKTTGGVYDAKIHKGAIPEDALEIPDELLEAFKRGEFSRFDVSEGVVVRYCPPVPTRLELIANAWASIKAKREHVKAGGVKVGDKWFHTDDASRIQHMALNMMGVNIPAGLQWKTMDGTFVTMVQALAGQVFQAVAVLDMQAFAKAEEHRAAMNAAENPFEYDFSAGWPQTYAEFVAEQAAQV